MPNLNSIIKWSLLAFFFITLSGEKTYAQEVQSPVEIMTLFRTELEQSRPNDTLSVYEKYITRLVDRGNYIYADSIFSLSANGLERIQDSTLLVNIYKSRAFMYKVQRRFDKSLLDYIWLTSYFEGKNDYQNLIEIYSLLGEYYRAISKYDQSDNHLKMAQSLFSEVSPTKRNLAYWYSRKAAWSNEAISNKDSVIYYAKTGLSLASDTSDVYTRALLLNELGYNAMHSGADRDSILNYFHESRDLLFRHERYRDYVEVVNNIGIYEYRFGSKLETIRVLESIVQLEEDNQWYAPLENTYRYLTGAYRDTGQLAKAVEMSEWATATVTRNMAAVFRIQLNDLALNYEKGLAEKELEVQEQKTETAEANAENNRRKFIISLVAAIILLILMVVAFQISIRFRRKNELLHQQQEKINEINQKLERSLSHQTTLYKELNHRVKNNLSILSGLIFLQTEEENDDNFKQVLQVLRSRIKALAFSHENLYQDRDDEEVDFHSYLEAFLRDLQRALTKSKRVKTHIHCEELKLNLTQATPLAMVINELFTNSLKHGFKDQEEGTVSIKANREGDWWLIEYADDGQGMETLKKKKGSLGYELIKLLLEQLDGTIENISEPSGAAFLLKIPHQPSLATENTKETMTALSVHN